MQVILNIIDGPGSGHRFVLRNGQTARVGRTEWADFSVPNDQQLGDLHFAIRCEGSHCRLKNLQPGMPIRVNEDETAEAELHDGDTIAAGATRFAVVIEGVFPGASSSGTEGRGTVTLSGNAAGASIKDVCQLAELDDAVITLAEQAETPEAFVNILVRKSDRLSAIKFLAQWLSKREAVWWSVCCVRIALAEQLTTSGTASLDAAENWVKNPCEENCRAAADIAEANGHRGPSSWAALGASWSGKSLAPVGMPDVPPPQGLTGKGVSGALMMAATQGAPAEIDARYDRFIEQGLQILRHEVQLPEAEA